MPGRRKSEVLITGLSSAHTGRASTGDAPRIVAKFLRATGLASLAGREVRVVISLTEMADLLGSIPALQFEDPEDFRHVARTMDVLRRSGRKRSTSYPG